jgi:hypothetical protein
MTELEKLALQHIHLLANELEDGIRKLALLKFENTELNNEKHIYPLSGKASEISRWVDAIEENVEKTEEE